MWLLDANMNVHLVETLKRLGLECDRASNRGWRALFNGDLVAADAAAGFTYPLHATSFSANRRRARSSHSQNSLWSSSIYRNNAGRFTRHGSRLPGSWAPSTRLREASSTGRLDGAPRAPFKGARGRSASESCPYPWPPTGAPRRGRPARRIAPRRGSPHPFRSTP